MLSTLDVIDNYLTPRGEADFSSLPGRDLDHFGERVREFSAAHEPEIDSELHPIYLGGWPSANFALIGGDLVLSSLLYSGQVLVRDPIADWFSWEQYHLEHMMSARPGYRPPEEDAETRMGRTRAFLCTVIPELLRMRPLIEAGIVVPVASEPLFYRRRSSIDQLRRDISSRVDLGPTEYAERFGAQEIASETNVRGFFAMAPGPDPGPQIQKAIDHGIRYFSREFMLASEHGVTYTAPFGHERFLCQAGISPIVGSSARVVEAVLNSGLPVFHGLTPKVVRDIHDDAAFAEFRARLHEVYQHTPVENPDEARLYIEDQENALLRPLIAQGEDAASSGYLARLGASLSANKYGITAALAADFTLGAVGPMTGLALAGTVLDELSDRRKGSAGPQRIWSSLVRHNRAAGEEMRSVQSEGAPSSGPNWGIPREPGMTVAVTAGEVILDADPRTVANPTPDRELRLQLGVYGPCGCGSGKKYRFCCDGLR